MTQKVSIGIKRIKQMADEGKTVRDLKREIWIAEIINRARQDEKKQEHG